MDQVGALRATAGGMLTRTPASSPCVVIPTIHTAPYVKVRYSCPRNHLDLQRLLLRGGGAGVTGLRHRQDPCQIAPEFDLKLARQWE